MAQRKKYLCHPLSSGIVVDRKGGSVNNRYYVKLSHQGKRKERKVVQMLEVYEIRIDEFERMLRNHTLVCPDWADERIDKLEQLITDNGVAYAIIGKDMFFNNAYSMAPSVIAVNDVDGIASGGRYHVCRDYRCRQHYRRHP